MVKSIVNQLTDVMCVDVGILLLIEHEPANGCC